MDLETYFESTKGTGFLSTSGAGGEVDCAVYAKPRLDEDKNVYFIMTDRLSHKNVSENPKAVYTFMQDGTGYGGVRVYLEKVREDTDKEKIAELRRHACVTSGTKEFIVYFKVLRVRPLVGDEFK